LLRSLHQSLPASISAHVNLCPLRNVLQHLPASITASISALLQLLNRALLPPHHLQPFRPKLSFAPSIAPTSTPSAVPDPSPIFLASQHLDPYWPLAPFLVFVSQRTSPSLSPNAEPSCAPTSLLTTAFTAAKDLSPVPHIQVPPTSTKVATPSAEPSAVPIKTNRRRWSVLEL
jgi:hypothetical protein